jgi:transcription elongation factor Elf1
MSCDICGRGSCCTSFHSMEEQDNYAAVIELFDKARDLRAQIKQEMQEERDRESSEE